MATKNIVIVADCSDVAIEQIKAKFSKFLPEDNLNFYPVIVSNFQINNGILLSKLVADEIPHGKNTLFLAIVNPLSDKPKRMFAELENGTLIVGADTGIFTLLFDEFRIKQAYKNKEQGHVSFGGLHMHTTIAAKLLNRENKSNLGVKIPESNVKRRYPEKGEVVHIDNFGLIKLWYRMSDFDFSEGQKVKIKNENGEVFEAFFSTRMMDNDDNDLVVYPGSSLLKKNKGDDLEDYAKTGLVEIGMVRSSKTAEKLNVEIGDVLKLLID